jgi:hypothetical protein
VLLWGHLPSNNALDRRRRPYAKSSGRIVGLVSPYSHCWK